MCKYLKTSMLNLSDVVIMRIINSLGIYATKPSIEQVISLFSLA